MLLWSTSQSTKAYSENLRRVPDLIAWALSIVVMVAKAQQDPQLPWSYTGFTAPEVLQSIGVAVALDAAVTSLV